MLDRRSFLALLAAAPAAPSAGAFDAADRAAHGGLGIAAADPASGRRWQLRSDRRFALAGTFVLPLAAFVWDLVDRGELARGSAILVEPDDVRPGPGSTEARTAVPPLVLAGRAVREGDATAADLLFKATGGAKRVTAWLERRGFDIRIDRSDVDFARAPLARPEAGDLRDTATPGAMAAFLEQLSGGSLISAEGTASLLAEMESSTAGRRGLRAALPSGWISGDTSGARDFASGALGFVIPGGRRSPACIAAFVEAPAGVTLDGDAVLSAAGRAVFANLSR